MHPLCARKNISFDTLVLKLEYSAETFSVQITRHLKKFHRMHPVTIKKCQGAVNKDIKKDLQAAQPQLQFRANHVLPLCCRGQYSSKTVTSVFRYEGHTAIFFNM
jgi:hypothetical protein